MTKKHLLFTKLFSILIITFLASSLALISTVNATTYTFTLQTSGGGEATFLNLDAPIYRHAKGTYQITSGDTLRVTAYPDSGYTFMYWEYTQGANTGRVPANPITFEMLSSFTLRAVFEQPTINYQLTITEAENGIVQSSTLYGFDQYYDGYSYTLLAGQMVGLEAIPYAGYVFDYWEVSGDGTSTGNPISVTMTESKTVTAHFIEGGPTLYYLTTIDPVINEDPLMQYPGYLGSIIHSINGFPESNTWGAGTHAFENSISAVIQLIPDEGFKFNHWHIQYQNGTLVQSTTYPLIVTATQNVSITSFVEKVTVNSEMVYSVTLHTNQVYNQTSSFFIENINQGTNVTTYGNNDATLTYHAGDIIRITQTPSYSSYPFYRWVTSEDVIYTDNPQTFTAPAKSLTITAEYYDENIGIPTPSTGNWIDDTYGTINPGLQWLDTTLPFFVPLILIMSCGFLGFFFTRGNGWGFFAGLNLGFILSVAFGFLGPWAIVLLGVIDIVFVYGTSRSNGGGMQ